MNLEILLQQQDAFNVFLAFFSLFWMGFLMLRTNTRHTGPRLLLLLFFTLSVGSALEVRSMHLRVDQSLNQSNIAWFILWQVKTISIYLTLIIFYRFVGTQFPKVITLLTMLAMVSYLLLWLPSRNNPSLSTHLLPRDPYEYGLFLAFYAYLIIVVAVAIPEILKGIQIDHSWNARLRFNALLVESIAIILAFFLRTIYVTVHFEQAPISDNMFLYQLSNIFLTITGAVMVVHFLPNRFLLRFSKRLQQLQRLWQIRNLQLVQSRLTQYFPTIQEQANQSVRHWLSDLDFYEYRILLAIMDKKRMLAGYLTLPEQETDFLVEMGKLGSWASDPDQRKDALTLLQKLEKVNDAQAYNNLVGSYQALARNL